jgi:predicted ATPase/DNA-binding winged helix-turn-helix (wHTH) protein
VTTDLAEATHLGFSFGPFALIPERQMLLERGNPVRVGGRALDILTVLVIRAGELVSKRELLASVWPNTVVEEGNLKVNMAALRRALGDGPGTAQYIATVTGRGYRFVAPVRKGGSHTFAPTSHLPEKRCHNLPTATVRVFGREDVINTIRREVEGSRLVSIVGAGGIGKTTVALAAAETTFDSFRDGVWLVDLSLLNDPDLVPSAIATAIGVAANSTDVLAALCEYLHHREMLLVFDSCEHIIEAAASCATQLLAAAAGVKILVTSREPLQVKGELVRRLPSLLTPLPSTELTAQQALTYSAVQLFVARATDRLESFKLNNEDAPAVGEICRRLDGLALAIELAATRIDAFGVSGLLRQLDDRFRLLTGRRAGPERHRTITATLDWSYSLLPPAESAMLRAVSVFAGTFDIDGASVVADISSVEGGEILAQLASKSLLATSHDTDRTTYRLLETTRSDCIERLRISDEHNSVRQRHAEHVLSVLAEAAAEWEHRPAREWGYAYGHVLDDLRGALAWTAGETAAQSLRTRLAVAGTLLWNHFSLTEECYSHASRALEEIEAGGLAGTAFEMRLQVSLAGATMYTRGLIPQVMTALQRASGIASQLDDADFGSRCLLLIGAYQLFSGAHDEAIQTLKTCASLVAVEGPSAMPDVETHLACAEIFVGSLESARRRLEVLYERDMQDFSHSRYVRFLYSRNGDIGNLLSHAYWLTGSPDTAARIASTTVENALTCNHDLSLSNALSWACLLFYLCGQYEKCGDYLAMLDEQVSKHGILIWRPLARFYRGALECAQGEAQLKGLNNIERAIGEFRAIGHVARMPFYLATLADALLRNNRKEEASRTIECALECASAQNERWCLPEILRIKALICGSLGQMDEAESLLVDSMEQAEETGALSWRMRAANDLAQIWTSRSRVLDAHELLLQVYREFTEGFETPDLLTAADYLESSRMAKMAWRSDHRTLGC